MATARQRKAAEERAKGDKLTQARDRFAARYDAAGAGRRISKWNPPAQGPARAIDGTEPLRRRARDSVANDWGGHAAVQKWTTSLVGIGIIPRWDDEALNESYADFMREADADGVLDGYGIQALGVTSWYSAGEVFLRRRDRSLDAPLSVPVQVQLIESDYCPMFDSTSWPGLPVGNRIRQGIELNKYGRRIAYWMFKEHPGEMVNKSPTPDQMIRIPASEISHLFEPKRPGQLRGVSELANILIRIRSSADFEDAVLDRQKLANLFVAFIKRPPPPETADIEFDPLTGLPRYYDAVGNPLAALEPGIMQELQPGEDVTFANPPEAGTTFSEYMRTSQLGTAAGGGLPYELFSGDIQNVSDRTLRVVINEFRRYCEQRQWHLVIPRLCQPMVDWWAEAMVLAGKLPMSRLREAKAATHNPHGWEYIHPVQDVEGKLKAIEGGLTSRSAEISKRGDDPKKVDQQRAADQKREKELDIQPVKPTTPAPGPVPADPNADPAQNSVIEMLPGLVASMRPDKPEPSVPVDQIVTATATAMAAVFQPMLAQLADAMAASNERHAQTQAALLDALKAANERKTDVNVTSQNTIEPTVVTVEPTVVNVAPTPVHVTVEPAAVNVTPLPTVTDMEHDEKGNVVRMTQTPIPLQ